MWKILKPVLVVGAVLFAGNYAWHFFTDPPSTASVCYTWSKATDMYLRDDTGIDGAEWLANNIKTEEDLVNIDPKVLKAMQMYDENMQLFDEVTLEKLGIRQYVIDACEKASPGSTKHS